MSMAEERSSPPQEGEQNNEHPSDIEHRELYTVVIPPEMMSQQEQPTLFGQIHERNVTFCIDTSGSMYNALDAVKEHLLETLQDRALSGNETKFNLIDFNSEVMQWSDRMVKCTPQTTAVAQQWIQKLAPKTGTNTLDALLTAFSDPDCDAIYLVTDGLPDQTPVEILDHVAYAARNRPVHCFYIQDGTPDAEATEFLQDLAMETYGSFHMITIAQHGSIERVTPVYRADTAAERIIRTSTGGIYPSNHKLCSVSTTLDHIPDTVVIAPTPVVPYPSLHNPFLPYPHYYPYSTYGHFYPYYGWSRYRPAHAHMKHDKGHVKETFAPGPGSLLIGIKVFARRSDDGYFYIGTVKSQILVNKFLVAFDPCKRGKYKVTAYQETFLHDIISRDDALRHSILPGDKVVAPMEPEGEKYGPGVVIDGQEKRESAGGPLDRDLVVSFHNGRSATVPCDMAAWIPPLLHQRITFELQLPEKVRREFADQDCYPEENFPGYPTSGAIANPGEFEEYAPGWVAHDAPIGIPGRRFYTYPYYTPKYPIFYKHQPKPSVVKCDDMDNVIPGTEMTKSELYEKVNSLLEQHENMLDSIRDGERERILKKRETLPESSLRKSDKSVTFESVPKDADEGRDHEKLDSGLGSLMTDYDLDDLDDLDIQDWNTRDVAVETDSSLFYDHQPSSRGGDRRPMSAGRPPWKYWKQAPAPSLLESNHYGPYRYGPFEEAVPPLPLETRQPKMGQNGVEWVHSMGQYVDTFAHYKTDPLTTHIPHPPSQLKPEKQGEAREIGEILGLRSADKEMKDERRRNFRRQHILERREGLAKKREEDATMGSLMNDHHRERIQYQLERGRDRERQAFDTIQHQRDARKAINQEMRERVAENQDRENGRDDRRLEALRSRRQQREVLLANQKEELEITFANRRVVKEQRAQGRWDSINEHHAEEASQHLARDQQRQAATRARIEHFHRLEDEGQKRKELNRQVKDQHMAIYRSQVLP